MFTQELFEAIQIIVNQELAEFKTSHPVSYPTFSFMDAAVGLFTERGSKKSRAGLRDMELWEQPYGSWLSSKTLSNLFLSLKPVEFYEIVDQAGVFVGLNVNEIDQLIGEADRNFKDEDDDGYFQKMEEAAIKVLPGYIALRSYGFSHYPDLGGNGSANATAQ